MDSVKYNPVASVLRQCDKSKSSSFDSLRVNSAAQPRHRWSRTQRTPQQNAELKKILAVRIEDSWITGILIITRTEN